MPYIKTATVAAHTVRGGLGGAESCGTNQQWDPNYKFGDLTGQCTPKGSPMTPAPKAGFNWGAVAGGLSSLFPGKPATPTMPTPAMPIPAYPSGGGMSTNTMIAIGLGAAGLLAIVMLTRK
jgi:hypothetical protein